MELDTDQIVDSVLPWDLRIRIAGASYPTRPLLLADVAALQAALESTKHGDLVDAVVSLLSPGGADAMTAGSWRLEKVIAAVAGILGYWKRQVQKNSPAIVAKVQAAMADPQAEPQAASSTSGSSTPP